MTSKDISTLLTIFHTRRGSMMDVTPGDVVRLVLAKLVRYSAQDVVTITPLGKEFIERLCEVRL